MSTPNQPTPWQMQQSQHHPAPYTYPPEQTGQVPAPYPAPQVPVQVPPPGWRPGYVAQTQELGYHRLALADPKNRWFTPLLEALIGVPIYLVISVVLSVALLVPSLMRSLNEQAASGQLTIDATATANEVATQLQAAALEDPLIFVLFFGSVALMFPCLWLARLIVGPKPWGLVHSVAGRMRWGWLGICTLIATLMFVAVPLIMGALAGEPFFTSGATASGWTLAILLVLVVLLVPFQAYAEELVFRGYLMQTLGRWLRNPAWAIVLPAPLFMLGHMYDLWAQLSILFMGIAAGFVTWRTGGLEAAIALHVVNNLLAMGLGIFGAADPFAAQGSTPAMLVSSIVTQGLYVLVVVLVANRRRLARTRTAQVWVKQR
ncbi:CPBP family intramembrane glutamic endopeptidase [Rothia nasisuis]|uniref:CPBP family intramembrane glutamic endopeptidase n=1 Tax=Rothia nasisuis TaxID=2109647 RepID=UPI001F164D0F|nr:type II CAAX endopeptidase family protein [Rothia nasisuis]